MQKKHIFNSNTNTTNKIKTTKIGRKHILTINEDEKIDRHDWQHGIKEM